MLQYIGIFFIQFTFYSEKLEKDLVIIQLSAHAKGGMLSFGWCIALYF